MWYVILSISLIVIMSYAIYLKISLNGINEEFEIVNDKLSKRDNRVEKYLNQTKQHVDTAIAELFKKKKGYYYQELEYGGVSNKLKIRVYVNILEEYENNDVKISYDKIEIIFNHVKAPENEIRGWIKKHFISIKHKDNITFLVKSKSKQHDRKLKLEALRDIIEKEEDGNNNRDNL